MPHVVWDWNGTLFADQHVVVEALNAVLDDAGLPSVDAATYRRMYSRPVQRFYEQLFGRPIAPDEWQHVDDVYHAGYRAALDRAGLAADAEEALDRIVTAGHTQSLLSMWRHEELVTLVQRLGIDDRFVRVDGLRGDGGGVKAPYLAQHLDHLARARVGGDVGRVVVVGDALDDASAAAHVGVRCILYDGGAHPRAHLERAGVPVAGSLTEALELAEVR